MNRFARTLATAALALAPAALAFTASDAHADGKYELDTAHTSVTFKAKHLGISEVQGSFGDVSGRVAFDGKDPKTIEADIHIKAASIDTHVQKRDDHVRSADFFDVAKFPEIVFKSKKVAAAEGGKFKLVGDLTLHGVTKEVVLDVEGPTPEIEAMGKKHVGAHAVGKLNRKDFGVGEKIPGMVVSEEIAFELSVEAAK